MKRRPARRARSGFSLVEVMVAILILGIAIVGFTEAVTTGLKSGKESEIQAVASLFAAGQIEKLRVDGSLKDEDTDGDCGERLPSYHWRQTISPAGIEGLHDVRVVVEETRTGKPIYELRTLLFEIPSDSNSTGNSNRKNTQNNGGRRS